MVAAWEVLFEKIWLGRRWHFFLSFFVHLWLLNPPRKLFFSDFHFHFNDWFSTDTKSHWSKAFYIDGKHLPFPLDAFTHDFFNESTIDSILIPTNFSHLTSSTVTKKKTKNKNKWIWFKTFQLFVFVFIGFIFVIPICLFCVLRYETKLTQHNASKSHSSLIALALACKSNVNKLQVWHTSMRK